MMKRFLPTPSMAVALLALIVALSGSAYAVNKIGTKQIKSNAVTTAKIKGGAVTGAKIRNGSVSAAKLAPGVISAGTGTEATQYDTFFLLTDSPQMILVEDVKVGGGQTVMATAVANVYELAAPDELTDTKALCQLVGQPSKGGASIEMSPLMKVSLGRAGRYGQVSLTGFHSPSKAGEWRVFLMCQKSGETAFVKVESTSMLLWAVRP